MGTRREFIKYKLKCLHRFRGLGTADESLSSSPSAAEWQDIADQRDALLSDLRSIDSGLDSSLRQYEATHGERFTYQGHWYIKMMEEDVRAMPELMQAAPSMHLFAESRPSKTQT